jgi:hypothetical protein
VFERNGVRYESHHLGLPTSEVWPNERYSARSDSECALVRVQWHRFEPDSPARPRILPLKSTISIWPFWGASSYSGRTNQLQDIGSPSLRMEAYQSNSFKPSLPMTRSGEKRERLCTLPCTRGLVLCTR